MRAGFTLEQASPLAQLSVAQAVQAIEADGALDDSAILPLAARLPGSRSKQVLARAWALGQRLGLPAEWMRWRHAGGMVVVVLAALMALSAWGLAHAVVGEARTINAMAALVSMLGVHALMLLAWVLGLGWSYATKTSGAGSGWSLGALALRLTARLPLDRGPHAAALLHGTTHVLQHHRLAPWAFGAISHTIWALAFVLMLLALWFGFSFRAYQLNWETTILSDSFFQRFVHMSGWVPSLLGFPIPDAAAVHAAGSHASGGQSTWAWWLMGCVLCYGLLPRVALALLCMLVWQRKQAALALDSADPYVRRQLARLEALAPKQVVDAERPVPGVQDAAVAVDLALAVAVGEAALLGFELPADFPWPPGNWLPPWQPATAWVERIAGSSAERSAVLDRLMQQRPRALLVAVYGASSPDRGTARFLRQLQGTAGRCALLLLGQAAAQQAVVPDQTPAMRRWQDWLLAERLTQIALLPDTQQAGHWLADAQGAFEHA